MSRRKHEQARRLNRLTEAQAALGWGVVLFIAALIGTIYLNQTSAIATVGRRVQILQGDLEAIKRENADIERQIAETQSLDRLQSEAARLGFVEATTNDVTYLVVPNYPAATVSPEMVIDPPEPTPTAVPVETIREALWLAITGQVNSLTRGEASE